MRTRAFTLVDLLVAIALVAILAGMLLPALARDRAGRIACVSNLRQAGLAMSLHRDDHGGFFPDRGDLETSLPGGHRPRDAWSASDPRSGWAGVAFSDHAAVAQVWSCPGAASTAVGRAPQTVRSVGFGADAPLANLRMRRFDRIDAIVPDDEFRGRGDSAPVRSLRRAANPFIGIPSGPADAELVVDACQPDAIGSIPGRSARRGGRNRLVLDGHVRFRRDGRTLR